jgi:membrane fusion protein
MNANESNLLFRPNALINGGTKICGKIVLAQPLPMRLVGVASALLLSLILAALFVGTYTKKVRVTGQFASSTGSIKVVAPQVGRLTKIYISQGQQVRKGQLLFEVTDERFSSDSRATDHIGNLIQERKQELVAAREVQIRELARTSESLKAKQRSIEEEILNRRQRLALQDIKIENATDKLRRFSQLSGYVSPSSLNEFNAELAGEINRKKEIEADLLSVQMAMSDVREEISSVAGKIRLLEHGSKQELARLDQEAIENHIRHTTRISSPVTGMISALSLEYGQSVVPGTPLATILPSNANLEVHLMVPSTAIGFISLGQRVLLRVNGFPYQKFGQLPAHVIRVEQSPQTELYTAPRELEPVYRVVLGLPLQSTHSLGQTQKFKVGMTLEADVLQDRRRLVEWLFEPVQSIRSRLSN